MYRESKSTSAFWALSAMALLAACTDVETGEVVGDPVEEVTLADIIVEDGYSPVSTWENGLGHIGVDMNTNSGQAYRFVVDTGASVNVIGETAAATLGISGIQSIADVDIGGFAVPSLQLVVLDLSSVNRALVAVGADPIDGVLGAPFLSDYRGLLDYAADALYFSDQDPGASFQDDTGEILDAGGYVPVPLQRNPVSFLELEAMINGDEPHNFIIDTGAVAATLDLETAENLGLSVEPSASPAITVGGALAAFQTTVDHLDVGRVDTGEQQLAVIDLSGFNRQLEQIGARPMNGLVGADFLIEHEAVVDYTGLRLFLRDAASNEK